MFTSHVSNVCDVIAMPSEKLLEMLTESSQVSNVCVVLGMTSDELAFKLEVNEVV